jgi:hypothetical protein
MRVRAFVWCSQVVNRSSGGSVVKGADMGIDLASGSDVDVYKTRSEAQNEAHDDLITVLDDIHVGSRAPLGQP